LKSHQPRNGAKSECFFYALQYVRIAPIREDFTTDFTDFTDDGNEGWRPEGAEFLSVKSVKSVIQFLWLRPAAPGLLRFFAANPQSPEVKTTLENVAAGI